MPGQVYLFHGDDTYAVGEARKKLESELLDPGWREFNLTVLPADAPARQIVEALLAVPFGGGARLVVVKDPAFLASKAEDPSIADLETLFERGLPDYAHLVLTAPKADSRLKLVKKLQKTGVVREFSTAKPWQLQEQLGGWIGEEVQKRGRRIEPAATAALLEATRGDRWRLLREIEKLTVYAPEGARITAEMVREIAAGSEADVFALTDALARKQAAEAWQALSRVLTTDHPLKVLAAVATIMRNWLKLKQHAAQGMSAQAIAQATGARSDFKIRKDLELIRAWNVAELEAAIAVLGELDHALKTGAWPQEAQPILLEKAIAQMLRPAPVRP